jgi:sialidase-1
MPQSSPIWTSDDQGKSYQQATGGGLPYAGVGECQIVELNNGSLYFNARNEIRAANPMPHHRAYSVSHNGGTTWSALKFAADLEEPTCMAGLINLGGVLYFSNPAETTSRTHMTLKKSTDDAESWHALALIWAGPAAYSAIVPLTSSSLGVVYERGEKSPYEKITIGIVSV